MLRGPVGSQLASVDALDLQAAWTSERTSPPTLRLSRGWHLLLPALKPGIPVRQASLPAACGAEYMGARVTSQVNLPPGYPRREVRDQ